MRFNSSPVAASCLVLVLLLAFQSNSGVTAPLPESIQALIRSAGETEDETRRFALLKELAQQPELDSPLRADLEKLMPIVDAWANGRQNPVSDTSRAAENGYLCRFIRARPEGEGAVYPPVLSPNSPLRPIWALYRGRMLIWQVIQSGPLLGVKERRDAYYGEATRLLTEARTAFPANRVIRMYLGEPIPWPSPVEAHPAAPPWANLQREGLEKLTAVIHWWIDERQLSDGQFGGGWGDDVEMWRWWAPILIGFQDEKAAAAQERLSSGMFQQPHLRKGFTSRMTDVEHSNEDTTDTILPMMHLRPEDPLWKDRALRLPELMRERWTARNERGFLQFKSIYFNVEAVDKSPGRAFDTVYHPTVVQPALLYWQRTGDPRLTQLFCDWLKGWVDATDRQEHGKPAGVLPAVIQWPTGNVAAEGRPWWEPFPAGHNDRLYNWPGAARLMTSTLLLAWHMSGDTNYLRPMRSMAEFLQEHSNSEGPTGGNPWIAAQIRGFLPDTLAKYRFVSGDTRYDELLRTRAAGYAQFRLSGDPKPLVNALRKNAEAFRSNWEAYTSEMRWTDRVISFTRNFLQYLPQPAPPTPSPETLYSSVTGDPGNPLIFPLNAVRWLTTPENIAALVTASDRSHFQAELFHFGPQTRKLGAEFYLLDKGHYTVSLREAETDRVIMTEHLHHAGLKASLRFELPSGKLCRLRIESDRGSGGLRGGER